MSGQDVAVIYIARGGEGGLDSAKRFLASYRKRLSGLDHVLRVVTKGWQSEGDLSSLQAIFSDTACEMLPLPDDGFDFGAYFRAAEHVKNTWLLCLNTHSEILADGWIRILYDCAQAPDVGAAGATGSWESHYTQQIRMSAPRGISERIRQFALLRWYRRHFPGFPNAHLRTNAFLIRRDRLLAFAAQKRLPTSKEQAWVVESGRSGLTRFLQRSNLKVLACGADGGVFSANAWPESSTYCSGYQKNLLVADSQTRRYQEADARYRGSMQLAAWGRVDDSVV